MRVASLPKFLVIGAAVALLAGVLMLVPYAAVAAPLMCDGEPATMVGTSGDDLLKGTNFDDVIVGLGGNDRILAAGGNDTICGNNGNDTLIGGSGDDVILGGNGSDWVSYGNAPPWGLRDDGVVVDLEAGTAAGGHGVDVLHSIENILGSLYDDDLDGTNAPTSFEATQVTTGFTEGAAQTSSLGVSGTTISSAKTATIY